MSDAAITFGKMETFEGEQYCFMVVDGVNVGSISRERPQMMGTNFRSVQNKAGAWMYTVDVNDVMLDIEDGTSLRAVKKAMIAAYLAA